MDKAEQAMPAAGATGKGRGVYRTATEMQRGGDFILRNLKAIVETGRPPLSTRLMYWMFGAMESVLPARSKTENWPLEGRK